MGEAALEHLGINQCCDSLEAFRLEPLDKAVHQLAPGPETVSGGPAALGQARQAALKSVAMEVRKARDPDVVALICIVRRAPTSIRSMRPWATVSRTPVAQPSGNNADPNHRLLTPFHPSSRAPSRASVHYG